MRRMVRWAPLHFIEHSGCTVTRRWGQRNSRESTWVGGGSSGQMDDNGGLSQDWAWGVLVRRGCTGVLALGGGEAAARELASQYA